MNLIECRAIIQSLKDEHTPANNELIQFYEGKEQQLIRMIKDGVRTELTACVRLYVIGHKK